MSTQVWSARCEESVRAHVCGHLSKVALSAGKISDASSCAKCGCGSSGASVIDRTPTSDLKWSLATCANLKNTKSRKGIKVRSQQMLCLNAVTCATFDVPGVRVFRGATETSDEVPIEQ